MTRHLPCCFLIVLSLAYSVPAICQSSNDDKSKIDILYNQGYDFVFTQKDSANYYFEKALAFASKSKFKEYALDIIGMQLYTNSYHSDLIKYRINLRKLDSMIQTLKPKDSIDIPHYKNKLLRDYGLYYYWLENYTKASSYFKLLLSKLDNINGKLDSYQLNHYRTSLNYLGAIYKDQQEYRLAESYYKRHINFLVEHQNTITNWKKSYYNTKSLLAVVYKKTNREQEALQLILESIKFYEQQKQNRYRNLLVTSNFQLANLYLQLNKPDEAVKALRSVRVIKHNNPSFEIQYYDILGDYYLKVKQFEMAKENYLLALQKAKNFHQEARNISVSKLYLKLGDAEARQSNNARALSFYQKAEIANSLKFKDTMFWRSSKPENALSKTQLLSILRKKITVTNSIKINNSLKSKSFTNTSLALLSCLEALLPEFESKLDKEFLLEELYPSFHEMISSSFNIYKQTHEEEHVARVFMLMEKSKNVLLRESVRNAKAMNFTGIPEKLIEKEYQLRSYITNIEKKLNENKKETSAHLKDSLFNISARYYTLIDSIERQYPTYYKLKYDYNTIGLTAVKNRLSDSETLLVFHLTDDNLFALIIRQDTVEIEKIEFAAKLRSDILEYYNLLSNPSYKKEQETITLANELYQNLLEPVLEKDTSTKLTIIPDGILHYVPFESLIPNLETKNILLASKEISYATSVTMLYEDERAKSSVNRMLAIAPSFKGNNKFDKLPFAHKEVQEIEGLFKGKTLTGNEATLANFIKIQPDYNLLHLATHTYLNDEQTDYSYLAFSDNDQLFLKDLYNQQINASLVTLSACETGIGKLKNGEGMISLARGFQYAGVPSLTTTLWQTNDQASSDIMTHYYHGLKKGLTKSKALQNAKLTFLKTVQEPELKHPYYWAGFIVIGNNDALTHPFPWMWLVPILVLLIILIVVYRKRSSKFS